MSKHPAPTRCIYCRQTGIAPGDGRTECGFCDNGKPLDTQEDWDRTWGRVADIMQRKNTG